jgi:hypothetical protein
MAMATAGRVEERCDVLLRPIFWHEDQEKLISTLREVRDLIVKCGAASPCDSDRYRTCQVLKITIDALGTDPRRSDSVPRQTTWWLSICPRVRTDAKNSANSTPP